MRLAALLEGLEYELLRGTEEKDVSALIYFSEKAVPGAMFFAVPGTEKDGTDYIGEAIELGAHVVVMQQGVLLADGIPEGVTVIASKDVRKTLAHASRIFYGDPCRKLLTIGVTGTKGKTSTAFMIRQILEAAGIRTGLLGTVQNGWEHHFQDAEHTTPQSADVQHWCRQMADAGCKALVMEVSSQGMKHRRVDGILFDIAVFTNLSPDHIGPGEHENFEEYAFWKSRLCAQCKKIIYNLDDMHWHKLLPKQGRKTKTFGKNPEADYVCERLRLVRDGGNPGVEFDLAGHSIRMKMPGTFNGLNGTAAAAVARELGVPWDVIAAAMKEIKIPGRVESVDVGGHTSVLVDYAHNGLALRQLLQDLREYKPRRLIVLFGSGGNRDRNRRFEMGRAAAELADFAVVTSDNPRRENPLDIIADIVSAMKAAGAKEENYTVIPDRREAIFRAVSEGKAEDIVLIAGKGHELYQLTGGEKIHFDDRETAREAGRSILLNQSERITGEEEYEENYSKRNSGINRGRSAAGLT